MKFSKSLLLGVFGTLSQVSLAAQEFRDDVHVLMYETDASLGQQSNSPLHFFKERSEMAGLRTTIFGNNLDFRGFGDKYQNLRPLLEIINQDTLIILADARDVALNIPEDEDMAIAAIDHFVQNFQKLTKDSPNAVVLSAESQCCVSAMSHAHPSEYFDSVNGKRNRRACSSGHKGCRWDDNQNIHSWVNFMHQRAQDATGLPAREIGDVYLNAGLMAGYPKDLINLLNMMDIDPREDDQAVLSGLMYTYPDMLVLDYGQEIFGNNQWTKGVEDGCVFEGHGSDSPLIHLDTKTQPLLIHTPGKFYACLDLIIEALGGQSQQRYHPSSRKLLTGRLSLAQQLGFGGSASIAAAEEEAELEAAATMAPTAAPVEVVEANYGLSAETVEDNYGEASVEENYGEAAEAAVIGEYGSVDARIFENYGVAETMEDNYGEASVEENYGEAAEAVIFGQYGRRSMRRRTE